MNAYNNPEYEPDPAVITHVDELLKLIQNYHNVTLELCELEGFDRPMILIMDSEGILIEYHSYWHNAQKKS